MAKYSVAFMVYTTMSVEVEARSEEEARKKAEGKASEPILCHQCANDVEIESLGDIVSVQLVKS